MQGFDVEDKITILLTRTCNAMCRHCGIEASPLVNEVIDDAIISKIMKEAAALAVKRITLTGGEPTLYLEKVQQICAVAHDQGIQISFITNGWWGNSAVLESITNMVRKYECNTCVSIDDYHSLYIPLDCSFAAVKSILDVIKRCEIISIHSESNQTIKSLLRSLSEVYGYPLRIDRDFTENPTEPDWLTLEFEERVLRIRYSSVGPVGRGADFAMQRRNEYDVFARGCTTEASIGCDGSVKPCCASLGPGFEHLTMGTLAMNSLSEIIYRYPQFQKIKPFEAVRRYYKKKISANLPPLANSCELCYLIGKKGIHSLQEIYCEVDDNE